MNNKLHYKFIDPDNSLTDFVAGFWCLQNTSEYAEEAIALPDGRIDLFLTKSVSGQLSIGILGLGTQPDKVEVEPNTLIFAIGFKLPATEYIFNFSIADLLDKGKQLPNDFWDFAADDLDDFDAFCGKASQKIHSLIPKDIDARKQKLFELIYASKGEITVKELSEKAFWSSRQMNRYFNQQFGLSLKAYCNILRFRASLEHIAKGEFFPELDFADQNHFIKQVKKFSGVVPTELFNHKNDRFILLSTLKQK
ncbi:AraC family transcriptional regulator [Taibaiella soli]|uniref:AraC family transcriptional regulator n=2 Tax=Taibaiella soli TaxID=1649169 RepID=A0A2W2BBL9_9BACT|nr:AraC family transcriptional regulator [Taibaiella soli]